MLSSVGTSGKLLVGVIHLPRLPSTHYVGEVGVEEVVERAVKESRILEELGYGGIIVENFGDAPFLKRVRDPLTLAAFTVVAREVVKSVRIDVGINLLRNSGLEAYSIALATGAKFIRVNSLIETLLTDSGVVGPEAPRLRNVRFNYPGVKIFADIVCKHGSSLSYLAYREQSLVKGGTEPLEDLVADAVERGRADALVVTGTRTGEEPDVEFLSKVKSVSPVPVLVGSGATPENLEALLRRADGVIVGSYIKADGKAGNPVDFERARRFISKFNEVIRKLG
ncbi:MAG: BtpA/SgcQ family protein [Desulfurococcaceae archaeon]|nr:BtpA/SgcQ family protein [Desulfurococcaceae archaeon]